VDGLLRCAFDMAPFPSVRWPRAAERALASIGDGAVEARQILRKFNVETVNASGIPSDVWSLLRPMEPAGMRRCALAGL